MPLFYSTSETLKNSDYKVSFMLRICLGKIRHSNVIYILYIGVYFIDKALIP